jgi:hypothetical protein
MITPPHVEPFVTLHEASAKLGIPYWKLQRACRRGILPTYRFLNSRILVRLSEVVGVLEASLAIGSEGDSR